ncbi:unnamed protein product [Moneuplotes crassus]|uniref:Uncharacterized protein n=1 Tax=Euplotes crassus TaxID=5936 RepID=A0AAD1XI58_EUPCR|nr:unnamed protein product [Moneuplotes crassus]
MINEERFNWLTIGKSYDDGEKSSKKKSSKDVKKSSKKDKHKKKKDKTKNKRKRAADYFASDSDSDAPNKLVAYKHSHEIARKDSKKSKKRSKDKAKKEKKIKKEMKRQLKELAKTVVMSTGFQNTDGKEEMPANFEEINYEKHEKMVDGIIKTLNAPKKFEFDEDTVFAKAICANEEQAFTINAISYDDYEKYGKPQDAEIPLFRRATRDYIIGFDQIKRRRGLSIKRHMIEIIRDLNELCGIYRKDNKQILRKLNYGLPKYRIYSKKFYKKNKDVEEDDHRIHHVNKVPKEFAESDVIDTIKDMQLWDEVENSEESFEDYLEGNMKFKY